MIRYRSDSLCHFPINMIMSYDKDYIFVRYSCQLYIHHQYTKETFLLSYIFRESGYREFLSRLIEIMLISIPLL